MLRCSSLLNLAEIRRVSSLFGVLISLTSAGGRAALGTPRAASAAAMPRKVVMPLA
jgi:hypothetical protein